RLAVSAQLLGDVFQRLRIWRVDRTEKDCRLRSDESFYSESGHDVVQYSGASPRQYRRTAGRTHSLCNTDGFEHDRGKRNLLAALRILAAQVFSPGGVDVAEQI